MRSAVALASTIAALVLASNCASQAPALRPPESPERFVYPIAGVADREPRLPIFSADGSLLIFSMGREQSQIYVSRRMGESWSEPERASFSDAGANFEPFLMQDGRTVLFGSTRPPGRDPDAPQVWRTVLQEDGSWSAPVLALTTESRAGLWYPNGPSLADVYFGAELPGQLEGFDLWRVDLAQPTALTRLPAPLNSPHIEWDPYLLPGGDAMLLASDRPGGAGGVDIYVAFKRPDGSWRDPQNLGPAINTPRNEVATALSPDGGTLFFIREPSEVFWVSADVIYNLRERS